MVTAATPATASIDWAAPPATASIDWGRIRSGSHALNQDRLPKRGNLITSLCII
jgi:hypothetical protein